MANNGMTVIINLKEVRTMARTMIKTSGDLTKREQFLLCNNPATKKMSDAVGMQLPVAKWALFSDEQENKEPMDVLAVKTADGEYYATNSSTFIKDFFKIVDIFGDELPDIVIFDGESKAGRTFITCTIADE